MTKPSYLKNAPITEALIDIRVKLPEGANVEALDTVYTSISDQYPNRQVRRKFESKVELKGEAALHTPVTQGILGYIYTSTDKKQIAQFRQDGFTFNRLKPYESWEQLRDEAYRLWLKYIDIAQPEFVTRVALRYINHLNVPITFKDFKEYLSAPPIVPEQLPQGVSSFLTRVALEEPELAVTAIITQALEPITDPKFATIILDIDVFKQAQFNVTNTAVWETLEKFRDFKDKIFFESITDKTKELFL